MEMRDAGEEKKANIFLYFSALAANFATFGVGGAFAWSSPAIPRLKGHVDPDNNPVGAPITSQEESWIASLFPLGAAVTCFISGYLADRIGRKRTLLLSSVPMIAGFILNAFATNVWYFYVGRLLNGLCAGAIFTVVPVYVGEIAENSNRGILGCFFVVFLTSGIIFSYSIGPYVSIRALSLCNVAAPVFFLLSFGFLVPESPYYWIAKDNQEEAGRSLMKLRRNDADAVKMELPQISKNVEECFTHRGGVKDLIAERYLFKIFCITGALMTFQQLTGINLVIFYMQTIFEESGSSIPAHVSAIIVGVVRFLSSVASSSLVDRLGRRVLLMSSAAGTTFSLIFFSAYFHLKEGGHYVGSIFWLPIVSIIAFVLSFAFGFGSIPFALNGELFPPHVKSAAATLTIFVCFVLMFCVTTFFPYLIDGVGMAFAFTLLAMFCCSGGVFVYFFVPETKGKSLQEIQEMLK